MRVAGDIIKVSLRHFLRWPGVSFPSPLLSPLFSSSFVEFRFGSFGHVRFWLEGSLTTLLLGWFDYYMSLQWVHRIYGDMMASVINSLEFSILRNDGDFVDLSQSEIGEIFVRSRIWIFGQNLLRFYVVVLHERRHWGFFFQLRVVLPFDLSLFGFIGWSNYRISGDDGKGLSNHVINSDISWLQWLRFALNGDLISLLYCCGVYTNFPQFDRLIGGLTYGDMLFIAMDFWFWIFFKFGVAISFRISLVIVTSQASCHLLLFSVTVVLQQVKLFKGVSFCLGFVTMLLFSLIQFGALGVLIGTLYALLWVTMFHMYGRSFISGLAWLCVLSLYYIFFLVVRVMLLPYLSQNLWFVVVGQFDMDARVSQSSLMQTNGAGSSKLRIKVPKFDNSDLIKSYSRTMIGQCMNPDQQDVKNLLYMLPRIWKMEERVTGTNMGMGKFRFQFENEEDIVEVQKMEPYHFDYWMLSLVKWTPSTERNYPYAIKFWVRVIGIPLQYQGEAPLKSVGCALGINEEYEQTDVPGGRVQVIVDGFKNLVFETVLEFHDGVEADVTLQYERLFGFCKVCFSLRHDRHNCPLVQKETGPRRDDQRDKGKEEAKFLSYKGAVRQSGTSSKANGNSQTWRRRDNGIGNGNNKVSKEASRNVGTGSGTEGVTETVNQSITEGAPMVGEGVTAEKEKMQQQENGDISAADLDFMEDDDLLPLEDTINDDIDLGNIDLDDLELDLEEEGNMNGEETMEEVLGDEEANVDNQNVEEITDQGTTKQVEQLGRNKARRVLFKNNSVPPAVNFKKRTVQKLLTPRKRSASRNTLKFGDGLYQGKQGGHDKDKMAPQEANKNRING